MARTTAREEKSTEIFAILEPASHALHAARLPCVNPKAAPVPPAAPGSNLIDPQSDEDCARLHTLFRESSRIHDALLPYALTPHESDACRECSGVAQTCAALRIACAQRCFLCPWAKDFLRTITRNPDADVDALALVPGMARGGNGASQGVREGDEGGYGAAGRVRGGGEGEGQSARPSAYGAIPTFDDPSQNNAIARRAILAAKLNIQKSVAIIESMTAALVLKDGERATFAVAVVIDTRGCPILALGEKAAAAFDARAAGQDTDWTSQLVDAAKRGGGWDPTAAGITGRKLTASIPTSNQVQGALTKQYGAPSGARGAGTGGTGAGGVGGGGDGAGRAGEGGAGAGVLGAGTPGARGGGPDTGGGGPGARGGGPGTGGEGAGWDGAVGGGVGLELALFRSPLGDTTNTQQPPRSLTPAQKERTLHTDPPRGLVSGWIIDP